MQVKLLLFTFLFEWRIETVSIRKPFERMSNFSMIRFLKPESEPNFVFFRTSLVASQLAS